MTSSMMRELHLKARIIIIIIIVIFARTRSRDSQSGERSGESAHRSVVPVIIEIWFVVIITVILVD